jgi:CBS domain containing-hemolysin-like protein
MAILVFWVCACPWARKLLYQMRARVALGIARRLDTYLSANQLGITLASLALG